MKSGREQNKPPFFQRSWETHFKTLFKEHEGNIENLLPKIKIDINEELNKPFSMTEFQTTISKLKNNKAEGPDRIRNEFIKHVTNEIKEIILKFLNLNLRVGITAENLCQDFITVIHNDGKKNDPDNYRGIYIANSILKILSSLLEARLKEFCKKHDIIDKAQIGFQENARTSDHILILKTTSDHILTLKTTSDHILTLKTTSDHILTLKTTSDHILTLKTTPDHILTLKITSDHILTLKTTSDHILTLKTTSDHILTLKTTSDHILTLKTTSDHILTLKTTSDHILTLKTIINKYVTDLKGKKHYSCFIDFKKAFDSVWHIGLFRKHSIVSGTLVCSESIR